MHRISLLAALAVTFLALPAHAEAPAETGASAEAAHAFVIGLRGGVAHTLTGDPADATTAPTTSLSASWLVSPHFELELAGGAAFGDATAVPLELLAKRVLTEGLFEPYLGIGPSLVLKSGEESAVEYGVVGAIGTYVWVADRIGLVAEGTYGLFVSENSAPEVAARIGVVTRF